MAHYREYEYGPGQKESEQVECTVLNLRNGEMFSPGVVIMNPVVSLTGREMEILRLIQRGFLSKEIADKLCISIHTVHIHRQNLLRKLGVHNSWRRYAWDRSRGC